LAGKELAGRSCGRQRHFHFLETTDVTSPPPLPLSLNPPFTPIITPLCRKSGGAQGGICQQNTEERNKEKEFKREKEKEILNTFFSNIHQ
jgi:hypothetical protein